MQRFEEPVQNLRGDVLTLCPMLVMVAGTTTPATIFADAAGQAVITSPSTDRTGVFAFYAPNGRYDIYALINGQRMGHKLDYLLDDPVDANASQSAAIAAVQADANALQLADYTALRAYTGPRKSVYVTGYLGATAPSGIAGMFVLRADLDPATAIDNAGTRIVGAHVWDRAYSGPVFAKWFGAKLDGATDDQAALQAAEDYCASAGKVALLDGVALIKSKFRFSAPWVGVKGKAKIIVASDFAYSGSGGDGLAAIINKNFSYSYNAATADYVVLQDIQLSLEQTAGASKSLIVLGNVKGGLIEGIEAATNTTALCGSLLDLYSCVKNLTVRRSTFDNLTQASAGGAMWVRNITSNGSLAANNTEHITIDGCRFTTTTVDEALAIYGVRGKTRDVSVRRSQLVGGASSVKHGTLASTFPLNDGSLISGVNYAAVEDVLWDDCDFIDANFSDHVLRFGNTPDVVQQCENIRVRSSRFHVQQAAVRTSYAVRAIKCVGDGLTVDGCHINATGSPQVITYGISGADRASGNTTLGNLSYAADSCKLVDGNPSLSAISGTFNCRNVRNNRIFATSLGVVHNDSSTTSIANNYIELTSTGTAGIFYNTLGNATTPASDATGNLISMANASGFAVQVNGSTPGKIRTLNNKTIGTGKTISGVFTQISGNDWYGKLDAVRAAPYLDYDHNNATPLGTVCWNSVPTVSGNSVQDKWIKIANGGSASDWKSLYSSTVAT